MALADATASQFYLAYLGRPRDAYSPDPAGQVPAGAAFRFAASPEYIALVDSTNVAAVVAGAYQRLFNRAPEAAGTAYWAGEVQAGRLTGQQLPLAILQGAQNADRLAVENKLAAAAAFVAAMDTPYERTWYSGAASADVARTWLRGFGAEPPDPAASQVSAQAAVDASNAVGTPPGGSFSLTTGADVLDGRTNTTGDPRLVPSSGADTFEATAASLGAADRLDGLGGHDRLNLWESGSLDTSGFDVRNVEEVAILAGPHPAVGLAGVRDLALVTVQGEGTMRVYGMASRVEARVDLQRGSDVTLEYTDRAAAGGQSVHLQYVSGPVGTGYAKPVLHLPGIETVSLGWWLPGATLALDAATTLNVAVPRGVSGSTSAPATFGDVLGVPGRLQVNLSGEGVADLTGFLAAVPVADVAASGPLLLQGTLAAPVASVTSGAGGVDLVLAGGSQLTRLDATASTFLARLDARAATGGVTFLGGSAASNELRGGAGQDQFTGGASGLFRFGHADFQAGFAANASVPREDTITDWGRGTRQLVDDDAPLALVENAVASPGAARIVQGVATFAGEGTLAQKIAWTEAGLQQGGTAAAGQVAAFLHGGDRWVFVSDGVDGVTAGDALVRLVGVQTQAPLEVQNGVLLG